MKTYRVGELRDFFGLLGWCIQEKTWYGWRTLATYSHKDQWASAVKHLKESKNCIVL